MCVTSRLLVREWNVIKLTALFTWCNNITWGYLIGILHTKHQYATLGLTALLAHWMSSADPQPLIHQLFCVGNKDKEKKNKGSEKIWSKCDSSAMIFSLLLVVRVGLQMLGTCTHTHTSYNENLPYSSCLSHPVFAMYLCTLFIHFLKNCPYVVKVRAHQHLWKFFKS